MTVETEKFVTVRVRPQTRNQFCKTCNSHAPMLTVTEAEHFGGMGSRTIFQLIGAGQLHFRRTATGSLLVCFDSLSAEKGKTTIS